ncbi:MAG: hypothetical protein ABIJ92_05240 [Candidatus Aenigmatarchaeota archaeon]
MFEKKCHLCGTSGKRWEREKDVFFCPNCLSVFSVFGVIAEPQKEKELMNFWS